MSDITKAEQCEKTIWDMTEHRSFGSCINWENYREQTLTGHICRSLNQGLKVGDLLRCPLKSGVIGIFELIEVDYMSNPPDLFFAKSKPLRTETPSGEVVHIES